MASIQPVTLTITPVQNSDQVSIYVGYQVSGSSQKVAVSGTDGEIDGITQGCNGLHAGNQVGANFSRLLRTDGRNG